jgi:hypothetical protein
MKKTGFNQRCECPDIKKSFKLKISAKNEAFSKNLAKTYLFVGQQMARGAGFEPARPDGPQA